MVMRRAAIGVVGLILTGVVSLPVEAAPFQVIIDGIRQPRGAVMVALCREPEYPRGPCAWQLSQPVNAARMSVTFTNVPAGSYALLVFQDLDGDRRLARSRLGFPREPIGFGNDAAPVSGPPPFAMAAVAITAEGGASHVTLRSR